jgi:hypothetical protein
MTAKDRRRALHEEISRAKQLDPEVFTRQALTAAAVARQAYRSSRIEGCKVELASLLKTAGDLAKSDR